MKKCLISFVFYLNIIFAVGNHDDYQKNYQNYPKYEFEYGVHDAHTQDLKKQWEVRDGDVTKGSYRLVQPDGRIRIVTYCADSKNGFNAEVKFEEQAQHPTENLKYLSEGHVTEQSSAVTNLIESGSLQNYAPVPYTYKYTIYHTPIKTYPIENSDVSLGYSLVPVTDLNNINVGREIQEPQGSELVSKS